MSPMPALRRQTAGALMIALCAALGISPGNPAHAQAPGPAPSGTPQAGSPAPQAGSPAPQTVLPAAPAPSAPAASTPSAPAASTPPAPAATPAPAVNPPPPAAAPAVTPAPGPAPAKPAAKSSPAAPSPPATLAKHPAKPERKEIPKPGPGAIDAGHAAASLRTAKLLLVSLIDRSVVGKEKGEIGHVIDVLVDAKGEPAALVVDVGGFMGMGNRRIAIAWERFVLAGRKPNDALQLPLSDAQVKAAPAYDGSENVTVLQGAIEPVPTKPAPTKPSPKPPAAPPVKALGNALPDPTRVDLGDGPTTPADGAAPPDPLNPD